MAEKNNKGVSEKRMQELIKLTQDILLGIKGNGDKLPKVIEKIEKLDLNLKEKILMGAIVGFGAKSTMMKGK